MRINIHGIIVMSVLCTILGAWVLGKSVQLIHAQGMQQGKNIKNQEPAAVSTMSRDIIRAKELDAHQSHLIS